jgi:hypothetical protein
MLNFTANPGVDKAPRSILGTTYISSPILLGDGSGPDPDDIDPETVE